MIRLTRIVKRRSGPVKLQFNTGDNLEAPSRVVNRLDISEEETYSLGALEDRIRRTIRSLLPKLARDHLSRYPKTSSEFVSHFRRKGYPESFLKTLVGQLRNEGFLDDRQVARRHLSRRIERKYYGRRKLLAELRDRGISDQLARELLGDQYPKSKETRLARDYARENDHLERRKLASRLEQRGFPPSVISTVLNQID